MNERRVGVYQGGCPHAHTHPPVAAKEPKLPPNTIVVDGRGVIEVHEWVLWNLQPWETLTIRRRQPDGAFWMQVGDPEHGGSQKEGALPEVLEMLHKDLRGRYMQLFGYSRPSDARIRKIFPKYRINRGPKGRFA